MVVVKTSERYIARGSSDSSPIRKGGNGAVGEMRGGRRLDRRGHEGRDQACSSCSDITDRSFARSARIPCTAAAATDIVVTSGTPFIVAVLRIAGSSKYVSRPRGVLTMSWMSPLTIRSM